MSVTAHDLTEAEWNAIQAARTAQVIMGGEPLAPYDITGIAREINTLRQRLEATVARADEAERQLRVFQSGLTDVLRAYNVPAMPSWAEALHWLARHRGAA